MKRYTQSNTAAHAPTVNADVLGKDCSQCEALIQLRPHQSYFC